jgi:hypothetical protein
VRIRKAIPSFRLSGSGGDHLVKGLALGALVVTSLLPVVIDEFSPEAYYLAPLLPSLLVGYAFRRWASISFGLVPLALGIAFGHPAGLDRDSGTEWLVPEWFVYLLATPLFIAAIAGGVRLGLWATARRDQRAAQGA